MLVICNIQCISLTVSSKYRVLPLRAARATLVQHLEANYRDSYERYVQIIRRLYSEIKLPYRDYSRDHRPSFYLFSEVRRNVAARCKKDITSIMRRV